MARRVILLVLGLSMCCWIACAAAWCAAAVVEAAPDEPAAAKAPDASKVDDAATKKDTAGKADAPKEVDAKDTDTPAPDKPDKDGKDGKKPKILVDEKAGTVTVPAVVAGHEANSADASAKVMVKYVLVSKGGKEAEAVFTTAFPAEEIHAALLRLGLKAGKPATDETWPDGPAVAILAEYELKAHKVRRPVDQFVAYSRNRRALKAELWTFTGSTEVTDPETKKKVLQAKLTQNVIGLYQADPSPLFQNPRREATKADQYIANTKSLPPAGTAVRIVFRWTPPPEGVRRVHVFITGRVQGVSFRAFTTRHARTLKLTGWVRNLRDGRVEAVIEGPKDKVAELLKLIEKGPPPARVDDLKVTDERPRGDFKSFSRRN